MCGIAGHISKKEIEHEQCLLMSEEIKHRGPDDFGHYFEDNIFLGHRRLSIIDLTEAGHQPMWDADKEIAIVFNGEIYNFNEIKKDLSEFSFKSQSDTEVIIYAFKKWGIEQTLNKLNGMFAFAIYDKKNQKCYFARDRIGIKPFVYFSDNEHFIFASELKAVLKNKHVPCKINKNSLAEFFIHRYVPNPNTIFENIHKLEPGHYIKLDIKSFRIDKIKYWSLNPNRYSSLNEKEIIDKAKELINKSVEYRLIADTEVAAFLSGGIDSSLISTVAKDLNPNIKAFTIDLKPEKYSEAHYAEIAAENANIDLKIKEVDKTAFKDHFDHLIGFCDEPFADSSLVPTYLLTKKVADSGIKCALSGDGGDEVFFGYSWYKTFDKLKQTEKILNVFPTKIAKLFQILFNNNILNLTFLSSLEQYRKIIYNRFSVKEINELFDLDLDFKEENLFILKMKKETVNSSELSLIDFHTFLPDDILYKVDIASMANSLEVRTPLLDHHLVEFMFSISFNYLFKKKTLKHILKEISKEYLTAKNINRKKKGFSAPVMEWISKDFKKELLKGRMIKSGFISKVKLKRFLDTETNKGKIWQLYVFEKWYEKYMN